jgi:hypothetical protein
VDEPRLVADVPYSNQYVVSRPLGFTLPLSVAAEEPTAEACPVVTVGATAATVERVTAATPFRTPAVGEPVDFADEPPAEPDEPPDDEPPADDEPVVAELPAAEALEPDEPADAELPDDEAPPLEADEVEPEAGQLSSRSFAAWALAVASVDLSELSCSRAFANVNWACWRLTVFEASCAVVGPLLALARVLSAWARFACADSSAFCALVGSIFPSTCPTLTWEPTATSTAVSVPLVAKFADAEFTTPTFPEALTLD